VTEVMIAVDGGEVWTDDSGGDGPPPLIQANREAAARIRNCELVTHPGEKWLPMSSR
jgi:hypothetical protein